MPRLPENLTISWTRGSKSFAEVTTSNNRGGIKSLEWQEAPSQKQLSEAHMLFLFHLAMKLARKYPERIVHYVRCDIESMPVTENNRPFTAK